MSQEMLANKLNISFQAVSKWENNVSYPDIKLIPKVAEVLGCNIGFNRRTVVRWKWKCISFTSYG